MIGNEKSILEISHAHKYYNRGRSNEIHVMNDIDLSLPEKGMVAIFGRSGCGKTTLLNAVGGLDRINSGAIRIFGENLADDPDTLRNQYIGYIFQNYNLNVNETVYENVADALRLCGVTDDEEIRNRVLASLRNVGMDKYKDRTPDTLSGGQQQRVAIARAICKGPAIILADEPTGNLDENNTVMVMDILKEISKNRLVLLVTHEANLVDFYCDRVIEIVDGKIAGIRENTEAEGYVHRNKNDIYLGELEKAEFSENGVTVERYGETGSEVRLKLISSGGKLYLRCETPGVRVLDDTSEVKLREGTFQTVPTSQNVMRDKQSVDMSVLSPVKGEKFGRLFHLKNAVVMAWRDNYSQRKKKGRRFLRVCLAMLAVVLVFMTAVNALAIKSYVQLDDNTDKQMFFLPLDLTSERDYNKLIRDHIGQDGLDYAGVTNSSMFVVQQTFTFRTAGFMTAVSVSLKGKGYMVSQSVAADLPLVCGTDKPEHATDILITTALADDLIESSTVSYIKSYENMLGLVSGRMGGQNLRIVGVVESEERNIFCHDLFCAYYSLRYTSGGGYLSVLPASMQTVWTGEIGPGELISYNSDLKEGETVKIFGREFKVAHVANPYTTLDQYPQYVKETYGVKLLTYEAYVEANHLEKEDFIRTYSTWLFEYLPTYLTEFLDVYMENVVDIEYDPWAITMNQDILAYINSCYAFAMPVDRLDQDGMWQAYLYHKANGTWPTAQELDTFDSSGYQSFEETYDEQREKNDTTYWEFVDYHNSNIKMYDDSCVVNDADYLAIFSSVGETDPRIGYGFFEKEIWDWEDEPYYSHYMMIHASDPEAAEAYLTATFGNDIITPSDRLEEQAKAYYGEILGSAVACLVIMAFMCLCVFFIMRSSFMSRVREVGILRAIGVSKKNLIFRFFVETALLVLLTVGIGYGLSALFIAYLSDAPLFSEIFYFPLWMGLGLAVVLFAAVLLFGLLPAMLLLRRTPSEILAQYDI